MFCNLSIGDTVEVSIDRTKPNAWTRGKVVDVTESYARVNLDGTSFGFAVTDTQRVRKLAR